MLTQVHDNSSSFLNHIQLLAILTFPCPFVLCFGWKFWFEWYDVTVPISLQGGQ